MADQLTFEDREDDLRLRACWPTVLKNTSLNFPLKMAERFIAPLQPLSLRNGTAVVSVASSFNAEWLKERCVSILQQHLREELGESVVVELQIVPETRKQASQNAVVRMTPTIVEAGEFEPSDKYRFDNFVVGHSNRMAFAAAKAVAESPGGKYNPLFIYGKSGLGKTHLMHAIAREVRRKDPSFKLVYLTAHQFAEEFLHALQTSKVDKFRKVHRSVGVWLVDDIQFILGKERTQEEIFYIFNALQQSGRQIVLCSDRAPRELYGMDERLRSRFECGLLADVHPPDTETRCAILLNKADAEGIRLPNDVAFYLAKRISDNIRVLEGAFNRLVAHSSLHECPITLELAAELVDQHFSQHNRQSRPNLAQILDLVSRFYSVPVEEIRGVSRKAPIVNARHVAIYIVREITGDSWKHIGSQFGDRDHTSMMHAHRKICENMANDRDIADSIRSLIKNLNPGA